MFIKSCLDVWFVHLATKVVRTFGLFIYHQKLFGRLVCSSCNKSCLDVWFVHLSSKVVWTFGLFILQQKLFGRLVCSSIIKSCLDVWFVHLATKVVWTFGLFIYHQKLFERLVCSSSNKSVWTFGLFIYHQESTVIFSLVACSLRELWYPERSRMRLILDKQLDVKLTAMPSFVRNIHKILNICGGHI